MWFDLFILSLIVPGMCGWAAVVIGFQKPSAAWVGYGLLLIGGLGLVFHPGGHDAVTATGKGILATQVIAALVMCRIVRSQKEAFYVFTGPAGFAWTVFLIANAP
jgi:hypothetical protein